MKSVLNAAFSLVITEKVELNLNIGLSGRDNQFKSKRTKFQIRIKALAGGVLMEVVTQEISQALKTY